METDTKVLKVVFVAHEIPEESLAHAQVAIVSEDTWHLIAPNPYRIHSTADIPMPEVKCPIVNISGVKNEDGMRAVMQTCVDKTAGVINLFGLLTGLEALGAVITQRPVFKAADVSRSFHGKRVASKVRGHRVH